MNITLYNASTSTYKLYMYTLYKSVVRCIVYKERTTITQQIISLRKELVKTNARSGGTYSLCKKINGTYHSYISLAYA